jgi:hypothetical protein
MNIRVKADFSERDLVFFMMQNGPRGERFVVNEAIITTVEPGQIVPRPSGFTLDGSEAQVLMDDLWSAGVRPTEGAGTAGSMAAVKFHLEDMRRLVFSGRKKL